MTTQPDLLFSDLFHAYLDTAESRAAGVPAAADCALLKMDEDTDERDPRLCIMATEDGTMRSKTITIVAVCRGTQPRSITGPWLQKVGERMADVDDFLAWLATQPAEKRQGWQFETLSPPQPAKIDRENNGVIESGIGVRLLISI